MSASSSLRVALEGKSLPLVAFCSLSVDLNWILSVVAGLAVKAGLDLSLTERFFPPRNSGYSFLAQLFTNNINLFVILHELHRVSSFHRSISRGKVALQRWSTGRTWWVTLAPLWLSGTLSRPEGTSYQTCLQCFPPPQNSASAPQTPAALSTRPPCSLTAVLGCRNCVISLFSGLFDMSPRDIILKLHPCPTLIPTSPPLLSICLNLKMSVMSWHTSSFVPSFSRRVFPPPCQTFSVFYTRAGAYLLPPMTKNGSDWCSSYPLWRQGGLLPTCTWVWRALHRVSQWGILPSAPHLFVQVLFSCSHFFFHTLKMPENSGKPTKAMEEWCPVFKNGTGPCHSTHVWSFSHPTPSLAPL